MLSLPAPHTVTTITTLHIFSFSPLLSFSLQPAGDKVPIIKLRADNGLN